MNSIHLIWLSVAALAVVSLFKLMGNKQSQLMFLLRQHVEKQLRWAKKRAASIRIAKKAAAEKTRQEADLPDKSPEPAKQVTPPQR